jgi:hypothetical protein
MACSVDSFWLARRAVHGDGFPGVAGGQVRGPAGAGGVGVGVLVSNVSPDPNGLVSVPGWRVSRRRLAGDGAAE